MPQSLNPLDLIRDLKAEGWQPGPPACMSVETLEQDLDAYREMECAACGHCRLKIRPFHRGVEYRLLLICRSCGNAEV